MINFGWGDYDKTYCVLSFEGHWTIEEFIDSVGFVHTELNNPFKTINIMIDLRHSDAPPEDIMTVTNAYAEPPPSFKGRAIVIYKAVLWKRLYDLMLENGQYHALDIHFVKSVDEAYQLLVTSGSVS